MRIHVLGGFLGSGKTTVLMKIASEYTRAGKKVAILVNEAGTIGVDGATIKAQGYNTTELPEGCICCTLTGALHEAIAQIKVDIKPDVIIVEPTGVAIPSKVAEVISWIPGLGAKLNTIGILDAYRFHIFKEKKPEFFLKQMQGSEFILMNKIDIASPEQQQELSEWVKEVVGDIKIYPISAKTGEGMDEALKVIMND